MDRNEISDHHDPKRLDKAGIPLRFRGRTLKTYIATTPDQQKALAWAIKFAEGYQDAAGSALLVGKPGTGKTHLAIGIALEVLLRDYVENVFYTSVQKAIRRVKESWASRDDSESAARESLTLPRLLILDEIGVQFGTPFEENLLFDVLNDRYENLRPTILLSNLPPSEVSKFLGERILDRLREDGGKVLVFDWDSYRKGENG